MFEGNETATDAFRSLIAVIIKFIIDWCTIVVGIDDALVIDGGKKGRRIRGTYRVETRRLGTVIIPFYGSGIIDRIPKDSWGDDAVSARARAVEVYKEDLARVAICLGAALNSECAVTGDVAEVIQIITSAGVVTIEEGVDDRRRRGGSVCLEANAEGPGRRFVVFVSDSEGIGVNLAIDADSSEGGVEGEAGTVRSGSIGDEGIVSGTRVY